MRMRRMVLLLASMALAVIFGSGVALADSPTTKEDCKNGGYAKYGFKNQGECIKAVKLPPPADTTAPVLTQVAGPAEGELYSGGQIVFESNEPVIFTYDLCRADSIFCPTYREYNSVDIPVTRFDVGYATWSVYGDTPMILYLKAVDVAGNTTIVERRWTQKDITPPDTTIATHPDAVVNEATQTFEYSASEDAAAFECQTGMPGEEGVWTACGSAARAGQFASYTETYADGTWTFRVRAVDSAGHVDATPAEYTFTVDTTP